MSENVLLHQATTPGRGWRGKWPYLLAALAVVVLDQATKAAVVARIAPGEAVEVIPGFMRLELWLNAGGVWGIGRGFADEVRIVVFRILPILITLLMLWHSWQTPASARWRQAAMAIVVGGAIGNLIDRLRLGKVVDFFLFHVGEHSWPAFNVADSAICVGIAVLMACVAFEREEPAGRDADAA